MATCNPLSLATCPIEVIASINEMDALFGRGTAFFYSQNADTVNLITNWHIVTGRHPFNVGINIKYSL